MIYILDNKSRITLLFLRKKKERQDKWAYRSDRKYEKSRLQNSYEARWFFNFGR